MFFRQIVDPDLGCAGYVLGCGTSAVVVDPGLDIGRYLDAARAEGARIETIVETHTHADHVSGRRELAAATGARTLLPWAEGDDRLAPGTTIVAGRVRIEAIAAPGHRPEHVALLVTDTARADEAWLVLTGDSLLVGDLARPDLAVEARAGAHDLHATLERLLSLDDGVEVWPGHVGGSLCGGAGLSRKTSSTIGFERRHNPLCAAGLGPEELAERLVATLPPRPPTVARVVARNAGDEPPPPPTERLTTAALAALLADPATVVVDGRPPEAFDSSHLPRSLNLPLVSSGLGTRAGWTLDPDAPIVVLAATSADAADLSRRLRAVALDGVAGHAPFADAAAVAETASAPDAAISVAELAADLGALTLVDVRAEDEWVAGHVDGALHVPLEQLRDAPAQLPRNGRLAVACAAGNRAAFAASWLRRASLPAVRVADGGVPDLADRGVALVEGE